MFKLNQFIEFTDMIRCSPYGTYQIWINTKTDEFEIENESMLSFDDIDEYRYEGKPEWIRFNPEIYDSNIIESFIAGIGDAMIRESLFEAFRGRGKYARIKSRFARIGLLDRYHRFENTYVNNVVIHWCESCGIPYQE